MDHDSVADAERPDRVDRLEVAATVLLGLAAVLIAWTAYQAQLWGGVQDTKLTESVLASADANDLYQQADSIRSLDQVLFVAAIREPDVDAAGFVLDQMSEEGATAVIEWFDNDLARPLDSEAYNAALYNDANQLYAQSGELFEEAAVANEEGDRYTLAATIVALVLFLAGVSLVVRGRRVRLALLGGSSVILAGALVYVASLPLA